MRKLVIILLSVFMILNYACITDKDKYKESDIFEEYEAENGFTILHLPPVLFKVLFSLSEDKSEVDSLEVLNNIDMIKLMFFEENNSTIPLPELKLSMNEKLKKYNYNLLTRLAEKDNDISIYIIENEKIVHEILITILSDNSYFSVNLVGELTRDEVAQVYKSINMQKLKNYEH